MKGFERLIVIGSFVNLVAFFSCTTWMSNQNDVSPIPFLIWNIVSLLWNLSAYALTIRDLYLRDFPNSNTKLTWSLLMFWTGGIGWYVYLFKHAFKPRVKTDCLT